MPPRAPAAKSKAWSLVLIQVGLEEANGSPRGFHSQPKGRSVTLHGVPEACSAAASLHWGRGPARGSPGHCGRVSGLPRSHLPGPHFPRIPGPH